MTHQSYAQITLAWQSESQPLFPLQYLTLQYITLHYITLQCLPNVGGEDDAAQLLSNEHALARNNVGMVPEHGTPLAQQNTNVGPQPSAAIFQQVHTSPFETFC